MDDPTVSTFPDVLTDDPYGTVRDVGDTDPPVPAVRVTVTDVDT